MKTLRTLTSHLALATLLLPAAQTPPTATPNPSPGQANAIRAQTAERRAATYKGPRVTKDSKALGRKFMRDSKPVTTPVAPVKQ